MPDSEEKPMPNERERDTVTDTGSAKPTEGRRSVLGKLGILAAGATAALTNPQALFSARPENILAKKAEAAPLADSTEDFKERVRNLLPEKFLGDFRELMRGTAQGCVKAGNWVVPSDNYANMSFARDGFWVQAALRDGNLLRNSIEMFKRDQNNNSDGHIATAIYKDGGRPENRDRDEESTMMYVFHQFINSRLGGELSDSDKDSLQKAHTFINSHVRDGGYVTRGETRFQSELGTYHYWADTFRPAGKSEASPEVIAYNQGLYCVTLRCLESVGVLPANSQERTLAEDKYRNMVNPEDGTSLPQREGTTIVDVSSLVGEALSFYWFNQPILSDERIQATFDQLVTHSASRYRDGRFLGFKVIAYFYGDYRPSNEFIDPANIPGNYQNGGSWLLYDALALYVASRHGNKQADQLFAQRLQSEVRNSWSSHEYVSTNRNTLGESEPRRDGYGWNSFIINLLS